MSKQKFKKPVESASTNANIKKGIFPDTGIFFIVLYFFIGFIPNFGSIDFIGSQWFGLSVLNIIVVLYIILRRKIYANAFGQILKLSVSIVYILLIIWASASYFYALNRAEVLVNLARMLNTAIAFFNICILLWKREYNFLFLSWCLTIILFIESISLLNIFFTGLYKINFQELVLSLKGNSGNKNIMGAILAMKVPFLLYVIYKSKKPLNFLGLIILALSILIISFINARATYLSVFVAIFLSFCFILYNYFKDIERNKQHLISIASILLTIFLAFGLSQMIVKSTQVKTEPKGNYGTVVDRVSTISYSNETSSNRLQEWADAIDYTIKHPFLGGGLGNWKLESIPYVMKTKNELSVPYHAHNDFFEMAADLGILGGVLFVLIFLIIVFYAIRVLITTSSNELKSSAGFSLIALSVYFFDAFLNFPSERTPTQVLFSFILAVIVVMYISSSEKISQQPKRSATAIYPYIAFILLLPITYVTFLTYKSMKGQMIVMQELSGEPKQPLDKIAELFPEIPNISVTTLPIQSLKARYYFRNKKYEEALKLLDEGVKANPYIYYSEFIRAALYLSLNKTDSAYKYGKLAFYNWPRASNYYRNYIAVLARQKDTSEIKKAFSMYVYYRNEPLAWNLFLRGMLQAKGSGSKELLNLADSALKLFPDDVDLVKRRQEVAVNMPNEKFKTVNVVNLLEEENLLNQEALKLFSNKNYNAAAIKFIKASLLRPSNYAYYENAGICYFANNQFEKAIPYFDKAISLGISLTGKSEYFKGASLYNIGKKKEACKMVNVAKLKNYKDADSFLKNYCN